jgi:hypothetical protein
MQRKLNSSYGHQIGRDPKIAKSNVAERHTGIHEMVDSHLVKGAERGGMHPDYAEKSTGTPPTIEGFKTRSANPNIIARKPDKLIDDENTTQDLPDPTSVQVKRPFIDPAARLPSSVDHSGIKGGRAK